MQDKEIDRLFRSGLEDFEAEPQPEVWADIAGQLKAGKRKTKRIIYLNIAASVLLAIVAGGYFINQVKVNSKKPVQSAMVKNNMHQKVIIAADVTIARVNVNKVKRRTLLAVTKLHKLPQRSFKIESNQVVPVALITRPAEQLAMITERSTEVLKPVVPDTETPLHTTSFITERIAMVSGTNDVIAQIPQAKATVVAPAKKHRINSFGDLINVVVSKVDKRKDKIIEFTNTGDDESIISGLNLGLIKIIKHDQ